MLLQEQQDSFRTQTAFLRTTISNNEAPDPSFLSGYAQLADSVAKSSHVVRMTFEALSALGEFKAYELMADHWVIESQGKVVASGPTFWDAAVALVSQEGLCWDELMSVQTDDFT